VRGRTVGKPDLLHLSEVLGKLVMRLLGITWRVRYLSPPGGRAGSVRGRPALFAFWHGRQLPLVHTHRDEGATVLVSRNTDGQYAANALHAMGFATVRGSTSRGGLEAVKEMASILRSGADCAITPDGPRGPACRARGGSGVISRLGGRPVVPMGASAWPAIRLHSWDRFLVPLPFSRVTVVEGRPLPPMPRGDRGEWMSIFESRLASVTAVADLAASPAARILYMVIRSVENTAGAMLSRALLLRPASERRERLGRVPGAADHPVWLHGSSLGELNGLLPFVAALKAAGLPVWVTCTTPAGRKFLDANGLPGSFAPLDTPACAGRFLERVAPRSLVLAETELWPCSLMAALTSGMSVIMVNGRLSERSMRGYRLLKPFLGRLLSCFTGIMARSGEDAERFRSLGTDPDLVATTSDAKACQDPGEAPPAWRETLTRAGKPVLVAGSVRRGEEAVVVEAAIAAGFLPVLAPRHLERVGDAVSVLRSRGLSPVLWSGLDAAPCDSVPDSVVVDVHGILARLYGAADAAFVGGTFSSAGGHNVLEPLQRGVPVVVGPNHWHFRLTIERGVALGVVSVATDAPSMAEALRRFRTAPPSPDSARELALPTGTDPLGLFRNLLILSGILPPEGELHAES